MTIYTGHEAAQFSANPKTVTLKGSQEVKIEFDQVIVALGRKANTQGYGFDALNLETDASGRLSVNENLQTRFPNIFGVGDLVGPYQFTHMAAHQAWFASVNALFGRLKKFKVDYSVVPWCTYTDPEVARVGLNEMEAKDKGIEYEAHTYGLDDLDRAIVDQEDHGFVKSTHASRKR